MYYIIELPATYSRCICYLIEIIHELYYKATYVRTVDVTIHVLC